MLLTTIGLNHKTAPLALRERVAFSDEHNTRALGQLGQLPGISGGALLSTCNRTEVYINSSSDSTVGTVNWLADYFKIPSSDLQAHIYVHQNKAAVKHVFRVANGLDSMVLGEPQILGQMKHAFRQAKDANSLSPILERLFQDAFSVSKEVRSKTDIGGSAVSVAYAAVYLAKQIFGDMSQSHVFLLGAGRTIELCGRHLISQGISNLTIANRTFSSARRLALEFNANAIHLDEISHRLYDADILISSTGSDKAIVDVEMVKASRRGKKRRPVFMVDIAVPRDIDPSVGKLKDVYLYNMDDLQKLVAAGQRNRQNAALQAEQIIEAQADIFCNWLRSLDAVQIITEYREQMEDIKSEVLSKTLKLLPSKSPEDALEFLANTLTKRFMHGPSARMREAGTDGDQATLDLARDLLNIKVRE